MAWLIEFDDKAKKDSAALDKLIAKRMTAFLRERVSTLEDPRGMGEALKGSKLGDFRKCRVGDCRVIASIEDGALRILVIRIGPRKDVCRR